MHKKPTLAQTVAGCFIHHPWLKLISLAMAILVWFYVQGELNNFQ